jgi:hypothetical protein
MEYCSFGSDQAQHELSPALAAGQHRWARDDEPQT